MSVRAGTQPRCPICKTTHRFGPSDYCKAQLSDAAVSETTTSHEYEVRYPADLGLEGEWEEVGP